jgi:hypothetical protein
MRDSYLPVADCSRRPTVSNGRETAHSTLVWCMHNPAAFIGTNLRQVRQMTGLPYKESVVLDLAERLFS